MRDNRYVRVKLVMASRERDVEGVNISANRYGGLDIDRGRGVSAVKGGRDKGEVFARSWIRLWRYLVVSQYATRSKLGA